MEGVDYPGGAKGYKCIKCDADVCGGEGVGKVRVNRGIKRNRKRTRLAVWGVDVPAACPAVLQVRYSMAARLLGIQIDAAINPGNSGGPAFADLEMGKVAGVD